MLTNSVILTINGRNKMMQQTCDEEKSYPPTIASFFMEKMARECPLQRGRSRIKFEKLQKKDNPQIN